MVRALGRVKSHGQARLLQIEPAHQGGWANALQIDLQSAAGSESCFTDFRALLIFTFTNQRKPAHPR